MKKIKKIFAAFIAMLTLFAISPSTAVNAAWKNDSTGYWYTSGSSYLTGWHSIDGNWYYFYSNGYMAHDCWIGNYYLNSQGAWTLDVPKATTVTSTSNSTYSNTVASTNNNTAMVYVASSGNGRRYHSNPNCSNMKGTRCITISEATAEGYSACKKCY